MEKAGGQRKSARPAWRRIAATLAEEIRRGRWRDGEALPTAAQLATRFGVHRHTLRKSLNWLRAQGLLSRRAARPRAVVPRLPLPLPACAFLPEHLRSLGLAAGCELLECCTVPVLPPELRERVPAHLTGPLLHVTYRVLAESQLLAITEAWLPAGGFSPLPAHLGEGHGLGSALRLSGVAPACSRHCWVEADAAPPAAPGERLALHVGVLALDAHARPLKLCLHHLDATRVRLLV